MSIADLFRRSRRFVPAILLALAAITMSPHTKAAEPSSIGPYDVNVGHGLTFTGDPDSAPAPLALRGYDPVSYFTDDAPNLGSSEYSVSHEGAIYWFTSAQHRDAFLGAPDDYLPQ